MQENLNYSKLEILLDIYEKYKKQQLTYASLSKLINISKTHPYYWELLKILKENNIIIETGEIGMCKLIKIDKKRLQKFIEKQEIAIKFWDFYNPWV